PLDCVGIAALSNQYHEKSMAARKKWGCKDFRKDYAGTKQAKGVKIALSPEPETFPGFSIISFFRLQEAQRGP
ncbi:MAG: hypothetical protein ABSC55_26770, partial [Syntrophorhabdales bacterium]